MKIVINHLTRMSVGNICVAGIDLESGKHIRPILKEGQLSINSLERHGGPFDIGNIVELGKTVPCPMKPRYEDQYFTASAAQKLSKIDQMIFDELLESCSRKSFTEIFGENPISTKNSDYIPTDTGIASLGCLYPVPPLTLYVDTSGKKPALVAAVADANQSFNLKVTDIRFFKDDHTTLDTEEVSRVNKRLSAREPVILAVGLTYPWSADPEAYPPTPWVQLNSIHFKNDLVRPLD